MTINTMDDIASAMAVSQKINIMKNITVPKAIGSWQSSWQAVGFPPSGGPAPLYSGGAGFACDENTVGAMQYSNASVQNYLAKLAMTSVIAGTFILADRLWSCGGMGFAPTTYTVLSPGSLPARITDNGLGCEIWVEQFIAAGAATNSLTVTYLDPDNNTRNGIIPTVVSSPLINQMQPVPQPAGSTGVKQIVSATNSNTWTSGSWGLTILKRIATIEVPLQGVGKTLDWSALGLPKIPNDACLMLIWQGGAATASQVVGQLVVIDK